MKFSIITPVYNSFSKMNAYFQSLENQTYKNFELILIDDCSTDNSYEELLNYKQRTSNIDIKLVQNEKNTGPGLARNVGLDYVAGDYITFIDSDDYIEKKCLENIYKIVRHNNIDCLIFDFIQVINGAQRNASSIPSFNEGFIDQREAISVSTGSTCCKVYKTDIILSNELEFPNLMRFEDMVFNKLALTKCNKIYYMKKPLYFYVNNEESIVNDKKNNHEKFVINAFEILENTIDEEYINELESIFVRELLYSSVLTMVSRGEKNHIIKKHIKKWEKRYPNWTKNDNIKYFSSHQKLALKFIQYKFMTGLRLLSYLRDRVK